MNIFILRPCPFSVPTAPPLSTAASPSSFGLRPDNGEATNLLPASGAQLRQMFVFFSALLEIPSLRCRFSLRADLFLSMSLTAVFGFAILIGRKRRGDAQPAREYSCSR